MLSENDYKCFNDLFYYNDKEDKYYHNYDMVSGSNAEDIFNMYSDIYNRFGINKVLNLFNPQKLSKFNKIQKPHLFYDDKGCGIELSYHLDNIKIYECIATLFLNNASMVMNKCLLFKPKTEDMLFRLIDTLQKENRLYFITKEYEGYFTSTKEQRKKICRYLYDISVINGYYEDARFSAQQTHFYKFLTDYLKVDKSFAAKYLLMKNFNYYGSLQKVKTGREIYYIEQESVFKLYSHVCNGEKLIRIELSFENYLLDFEYKEIRESIKNWISNSVDFYMYCYYRTSGVMGSKDIFLHHLVKAIMRDNFIKHLDNRQNIFIIDISIK